MVDAQQINKEVTNGYSWRHRIKHNQARLDCG